MGFVLIQGYFQSKLFLASRTQQTNFRQIFGEFFPKSSSVKNALTLTLVFLYLTLVS